MADVMTLQEKKGPLADTVVAWSGDGNNVAVSWIHAAARFGFDLHLACPEQLPPPQTVLDWARREGGRVTLTGEPRRRWRGADCVVTDTWVSMGAEASVNRHNLLAPYRVDERLMALAKPDAIFMHCLPAHRGEEVTAGGHRRAAIGRLGRGGKPPARPEGHPRLVPRLTRSRSRRAAAIASLPRAAGAREPPPPGASLSG